MGVIEESLFTEAEQEVERESQWIKDEIEAYEEFVKRIRQYSPSKRTSNPEAGQTSTATGTGVVHEDNVSEATNSFQQTILTAYAETVFAVDHWQRAYGDESVVESIQKEFSTELATALSTTTVLSVTLLKSRLIEEAKNRRKERETFIEGIRKERSNLQELRTRIEGCIKRIHELHDSGNSFQERLEYLNVASDVLEDVAHTRQRQLHSSHMEDRNIRQVVYKYLHTDYPILSFIAMIREKIDTIELKLWSGYI